MIIKNATGVAFAAACLTSIATLPAAHAQMSGTYGSAPGAYGTAPGNPGDGAAPGTNGANPTYGVPTTGYGSATGNHAPQTQYAPPPAAGTGGTQTVTNGPQTNTGDISPDWSAQRNVRESEHYDRLLEANPGFRQARIRKECGPVADPQLHQQCLDSFAQYEPGATTGFGSSTTSGRYESNYGR
jgi:hypothetical protein